ncbi:sensor histidine kinase [Sphingobacterium humi]|uniref:histidine kinase n=1 Tax=Sphingobacterium humi TaxID=1796905 RepID=A0A6N8L0W7_9SPHI|nr:HAMP domain-containing sensor histidine kinase [Sphingobacterium humi]MVZ61788.1 sensor histidine kinase [Sphingobacterium humi]
MLKKYKILILAIILTAGGITLVLSIWLYGSYQNRKMYFLGTADHLLFDVIQDFYQENEEALLKRDQVQPMDRIDSLASALQARYPQLNKDSLSQLLAQNGVQKDPLAEALAASKRGKFSGRRLSKHLISTMAIRNINWDAQTLDTLSNRLRLALQARKLYSPFALKMVTLTGLDSADRDQLYKERYRAFKTRPISIDPQEDRYLEIDFKDPRFFLIFSIGWQLSISICLVFALIGTFFYLLATIKKQNQLAMLRKAFVNNMTHELKTPVSTVMAAVESIQRYGAMEDKERMNRYLNISKHELEHLSNMIERVLQVDIAETNGIKLNKTNFNLVMLIEECMENARLFSKKPVDFHLQLQTKETQLFADQAHLKNVLSNLFDNAVKYAGETVKIDVILSEEAGNYKLQIRDNGQGIPKAYVKDIFDLFFRVPSGDIHDVKGFGLGLAYVKQVINQHHGHIAVESELGVGSNFVISIAKEGA